MRIEGVPDGSGGLLVRIAYWLTRRRFGRVLDSVRVLAHNKHVLKGAAQLTLAIEKAKTLPSRLKHLVEIRAAQVVDCPY